MKHHPVPVLRLAVFSLLLFFLWPVYANATNSTTGLPKDTAKEGLVDHAISVFNKIKEKNKFINFLTNESLGTLPVGLVREINGKVYVIAIDSIRMTPQGAYLSAYFRFNVPGTSRELIFGGKDIAFTPGGVGVGNSTKLLLLNDQRVNFNEHVELNFPGDGSNFVEWDCNGFKSANLSGVFEFDKGWIEPDDPGKEIVQAVLSINSAKDLSNIIADINIPPFRIKGLKDFNFKVKHAVIDMSDLANPSGLDVTADMLEDPSSPLLWRGFYLQELEVGLPEQVASAKGRPKVTVSNFIIDDQGVSGSLEAENIVKLGDASAGGWPMSIDKVGLSFSKNKLNGGSLGGEMRIGFLGDDPLAYDAAVSMRGNDTYYSFALATTKDKTYSFFAGKITLNKDCRIEVTKTAKDFIPKATLTGKVELNKSVLNIKDISFEDLTLSTQKPYVHSGTFEIATAGDAKMSGFPIAFDELSLGISEGKVAVGATVMLNFMGSGDKGFSGSTSFTITAAQEEIKQTVMVDNQPVEKVDTRWKLDKVTISDIDLNVKVMAFQMHGIISLFDNHPVYGNGFRGKLDFALPGPIPKASATAYFGSKDDFRYWHVDAYIGVRVPIPPMLQITGMMGGMSYHMERPSDFDPYDSRNAIDEKGGLKDVNEIFKYVPSKDAGLGFMGGVTLALSTDVVINANLALEVQFGTNGGFRYAQFDGAGYVMHQVVKAKSKNEAKEDESAPVWVQFKMRFDNVNSSFDASIKTYVNIAGIVKGAHERGLVGESVLHVGKDDWYLYIGRPSQMNALSIAGVAEVSSYFMMGSKVEDMPPVPVEVSEVFDNVNTNFMAMENTMSTGKGFGFGAHFKAGFSFDYGIYGEFAIGAGADILLRNYGEARCKGSNSIIGFNGWYASGQAYAYLKGNVGIRVKVLGKKRSFDIAKLSAAILVQAKLPNPSWFRGMAGVKYSVLGGLVKGTANIKVELGSQCEIVGAKEINVEVISDIKPDDQGNDVSVFSSPQVAFNLAIEKPFSMMNELDQVATYRVKLDEVTLMNDKTPITGAIVVNPDGMSATLNQRDILPGLTKLTAGAKVHFEKQNGASWDALKSDGRNIDYETKSSTFTTGEEPKTISWENVVYAYPVRNQYNFFPGEYNKGYLKLKYGQPKLFRKTDDKGESYSITAAFTSAQKQVATTSVSYDEAAAQVNFDIPADLSKETIYTYNIVRSSLSLENAANNVTKNAKTTVGEDGDSTTLTQTALKGNANSEADKEVISYNFRTSRYGTFAEKMNNVTGSKDLFDIAIGYVTVIGTSFNTQETFDRFDVSGDATFSTKPLILLKAGTNNEWLQNQVMPLLYNGYPFAPSMTLARDVTTTGGLPPLEAVRLYNNDNNYYQLESNNVSDGIAPVRPGQCRFMYYVPYVAHEDYMDLNAKAGRLYTNGTSTTPAGNLLLHTFPDLQGNIYYPVELQYRLPGINKVTSTVTKSIYYKL
ncbi:hypothetical protein [Chitinophaga filiformis]|uniref:Uncharacterized protein n=1 Tax=Chitinophaga filiformis TaxID=104663 RepID=A0ABY4HYC7_CHIFI|nr:hypothetical protein [Chitinophaga filiformis]UPK68400.1 hypothetical protein MYF79_25940 [Chitinophaga filiformis]